MALLNLVFDGYILFRKIHFYRNENKFLELHWAIFGCNFVDGGTASCHQESVESLDVAPLDAWQYLVGCCGHPESNVGPGCPEYWILDYIRHWHVGLVCKADL